MIIGQKFKVLLQDSSNWS